MPCVDFISVPDESSTERMAFITPYYPMGVDHFIETLNDDAIANVALCCFASIIAFQNYNLCHGDIKPKNLMFAN
jgi:hypothetical protein